MGQAKQRGNFETRKNLAILKKIEKDTSKENSVIEGELVDEDRERILTANRRNRGMSKNSILLSVVIGACLLSTKDV